MDVKKSLEDTMSDAEKKFREFQASIKTKQEQIAQIERGMVTDKEECLKLSGTYKTCEDLLKEMNSHEKKTVKPDKGEKK